jgi:hypothetical protein
LSFAQKNAPGKMKVRKTSPGPKQSGQQLFGTKENS